MGFSLKKLVQDGVNDVRGAVTHASTAQPRLPQQGQQGFGVVRPGAQVMRQPTPQQPQSVLRHSLQQVGTAASLGVLRVGTGLAQDVSGLSDLAGRKLMHTAPNSTNRVSKGLDNFAKQLDQTVQTQVQGPARAAYKITQGAGSAATFLAPNVAAAKIGQIPKIAGALEHAAPVLRGFDKVVAPVGKAIDKVIPDVNAANRIASATIKGGISRGNVLNAVAGTAGQTGAQSSKGGVITPQKLAENFGANLAFGAGLAGAGQTGREVLPGVIKGAKAVDKTVKVANDKKSTNDGIISQQRQLDKEHVSLQNRLKNTPIESTVANNNLQAKIDTNRFRHAALESQKQSLSPIEKVATAPVGLGTKPVRSLPDVAVPAPEMPPNIQPRLPDGSTPTLPPVITSGRGRKGFQEAVNPRPLSAEDIASLPANRTTQVALNDDRLNTGIEGRQQLRTDTSETIEKMSNKDVQRIAKSAGLNTKTYTIQETRQKIAEDLNVRQDAVRLQREAETARQSGDIETTAALIKQSAERGRTSRSQGTDIARQLQARRIIANELDTPQQRIFKLLDNAGVNPDVYAKRLATVNFDKPKEVVDAYRDLVPAKFGDWLDKYRYTNMLSSPSTQINNFSGNLQGGAVVRPVQKAFEAGVDTLHSALTGAPRTRKAGEAFAYSAGYARALPDAVKAFSDSFLGKTAQDNPDFGDLAHSPLATKGIKGAADKLLSFVPKLMESFDEASQAQIRAGETKAFKYRESKGIKVSDIEGRAQEAADYTLFRKDLGSADQGHLLSAIDFIPQKVQEGRSSKNPVIRNSSKLIFPFVKTPANISKQMIEYSPLGVATLPGNVDKTSQIAKAVMGTALVGVTSGTLAANNRLTFATPTDAKEKQKFLAEGKQAYSFKVGNKWISYQKLHPALSFQMAAVAAVHESLTNDKMDDSTADKTLNGLASISRFFVDQSYFKNAQDFLNNASGTGNVGSQAKTAVASQASNIANQFVPARAAQTWLNNFIDKVQRQPDSAASGFDQFKQQFSSQLPGLSKNVPSRKDNLGNDLPKQSPVLNNFSPARVSTEKNDQTQSATPLKGEVDRLARQDNSIALTPQASKQKIAGTDAKLDKGQTKALTDNVNTRVKDGWNKIIATPEYKALSDEDKRHALSTWKTDATSASKRDFGASNNIELKDKPSRSDEAILGGNVDYATYAKGKNSQGSYVSDTVNKTIAGHSKKVLTEYNGLTAEQRKSKAYKEPDYDYKVAQAKYDNDLANNKLSTAGKITAQQTLDKARVGSKFTKDTRDLYGLTNAELYNYVHDNSDGKAVAQKVIDYGDALAKAGVISQNKFKDKKGNITLSDPASKSSSTSSKRAGKLDWSKQIASSDASSKALRSLITKTRIHAKTKAKVA